MDVDGGNGIDSSGTMDSQFGHLLSTSADIAERILRHMSGLQLNTCAIVCSLWNSTAKRLKRERTRFSHCAEMKATSASHGKINDLISDEVAQRFFDQLSGTWCEPGHALVFVTGMTSRGLSYTTEAIHSYLPSDCLPIVGLTKGIVGTPSASPTTSLGHPTELERGEGLSGLLVPSVLPDGACVRPFSVDKSHFRLLRQGKVTDEFCRQTGLPAGDETSSIKCLLWFFTGHLNEFEHYGTLDALYSFEDSCLPHRFAIGCAYLKSLTGMYRNPPPRKQYPMLCAGYCFLGDGVQSASVVLPWEVEGASAVERELRRLKAGSGFESWPVGGTVGFMLATDERGTNLHHGRNVEADAFARVFPGVPLTGLFGEGGIGSEYLPLHVGGLHLGVRQVNDFWGLEATTAFVLLCLGGR